MNIVLTGGSSGIGYHTALEFMRRGENQVFVISRNAEKLRQLKEESLRLKLPGNLIILAGDLCIAKDRLRMKDEISQRAKDLDILVNNAGLLIHKRFEELNWEDWQTVFATNVFATAAWIRDILPLLSTAVLKSASYRAHIVNISSMGGLGGTSKFSGLSAYSSSKAAMVVMTECLAEEFKDRNISVNGLALGSVQTTMFNEAFPGMKAATSPESMAEYVADFALRGAAFFNGKNLPVSISTP